MQSRCKRHKLPSLPLPSAPSSAGPTLGSTSSCSARASWNGSRPSWNCPTGSRPTTPPRPGDVFSRWTRSSSSASGLPGVSDLVPGEVVAIDGKTVRRSHDRNSGKRAIHPVSWYGAGSGQRLGLGQHADPRIGYGASSGPSEDRGEVQRNHCHSPVAANAGTERVHRHHRRHGLPEGHPRGIPLLKENQEL